MSVLASYIAIILVVSYNYVDVEMEDQIFQVKYIVPPLHSVLNENSREDKIFQRGPNISVPGIQKFQQN